MTGAYRGRFAPSPTGPLHWGSLYAAVASWLDARAHHGAWLVRIEDVDGLRCDPAWSTHILHTLHAHALIADEPVVWQSHRHGIYERYLHRLLENGHVYPCPCSRKDLHSAHRADCPARPDHPDIAWRLHLHSRRYAFYDRRLGLCTFGPFQPQQDPVLLRRDGFWAYQMAVVVDDIEQGITDIVRGEDLLDSTPVQLHLYKILGQRAPRYLHLPLVTQAGQKLSKQNLARPVDPRHPGQNLLRVLTWLGVRPDLPADAPPAELLASAVRHWPNRQVLAGGNIQLRD